VLGAVFLALFAVLLMPLIREMENATAAPAGK
jgi:hypothetical protein